MTFRGYTARNGVIRDITANNVQVSVCAKMAALVNQSTATAVVLPVILEKG